MRSLIMNRSRQLFLYATYFLSFLFLSPSLSSQVINDFYCGSIEINRAAAEKTLLEQQELSLMDRFGNLYFPKELLVDPFELECTNAGHFALDFNGNFSADEKATICQVFQDLSSMIVSQQNGIPIRVTKSDLATGIYGAASAIWRNDVFSGGCGIDRSLIWEHINSNVSYDEALQDNYFAGTMQINNILPSGQSWHTLAMDGSGGFGNPTINPDDIDMYSVVLHEALHMLGFESLIKANGDPTNGLYAPWDQFLVLQSKMFGAVINNTNIIRADEDPSCCDFHQHNFFTGPPKDLDHSCGNTGFVSERVMFDIMDLATVWGEYLPNTFSTDDLRVKNELSHINQDCDSDTYVMHSSLGTGIHRRVVSDTEKDILCRLDYTINGQSANCAADCVIIPVADGILETSNSRFEFTADDLLANDILPVEEVTVTVSKCDDKDFRLDFENGVYVARQLIPGNFHKLCYSVSACGQCVETEFMIYYPLDAAVILPGNPPDCNSGENLINYGDFEDFSLFSDPVVNEGEYHAQLPIAQCRIFPEFTSNSVDVLEVDGNQVAFIAGNASNPEVMFMELSRPLQAGCSLDIQFRYSNYNQEGGNAYFQIFGLTKDPCQVSGESDCQNTGSNDIFCIEGGVEVTSENWVNYTPVSWTNTSNDPIRYIAIVNNSWKVSPSGTHSGLIIDDVVLTDNCDFTLDISPTIQANCVGQDLTVEYEVCLSGTTNITRNVTLEIEVEDIPGVVLNNSGDFQSDVFVLNNVVANGPCQTVTLALDVANSPLAEGEAVDITLQALAASICHNPITTQAVMAYCCDDCISTNSIGNTGSVTKISDLVNAGTLPSGLYEDSNQLCVEGTLEIDQNYSFRNANLRMGSGAKIIVTEGNALALVNSSIRGCQQMWEGIFLEAFSDFKMVDNSLIADAQFGVYINPPGSKSGAGITIINSNFSNNYISIYLSTINYDPYIFCEGNTFSGGLLKPLYPGQTQSGLPPYDGKALTGIWLEKVSGVNIPSNTFDGLSAGIVSRYSNIRAAGNVFKNIRNEGYYAPKSSWTNSLQNEFPHGLDGFGVLAIGSANIVQVIGSGGTIMDSPNFENCTVGVDITGAGLRVLNNHFKMVKSGVNARLVNAFGIEVENNFIEASQTGIYLNHNKPSGLMSIQSNDIQTQTFNAISAILIDQSITPSESTTIQGNTIAMFSIGDGICVRASKEVAISNNTVVLKNGPSNRYGINLEASNGSLLDNNTIIGTLAGSKATGIHVMNSEDVNYCCNLVDGSKIGVYIDGNCISEDRFKRTSFNSHEIGLVLGETARLGEQKLTINTWSTDQNGNLEVSSLAALHKGGVLGAQISPFSVTNNINEFPSQAISPNDWFTPGTGTPVPNCSPTSCTTTENQLNGNSPVFAEIINGTFGSGDFATSLQFQGERYLYRRANLDPLYQGQNNSIGNFLSNNTSTNVGKFNVIDSLLLNFMSGNIPLEQQLQNNLTQVKGKIQELYQTDSLLILANPTDSLTLLAQKATLFGDLEILWSSNETLGNQIYQDCMNSAPYLESMNNAILPDMDIQACEQSINDIYLGTNGIGGMKPSQNELDSLRTIANLCPLAAGQAVYRARTILSMLEGPQLYYDSLLCVNYAPPTSNRKAPRRPILQSNLTVKSKVFPNPTKGSCTLIFGKEIDGDGQIIIYNTLGQKILQTEVYKGESYKELQIESQNTSGLFLLKFFVEQKEVATHQVFLSR